MGPAGNTRNRVLAATIAGAVHVVLLWLIWDTHFARKTVVEDFGSIFFFSPRATESPRTQGTQKRVPHLQAFHDLPQLSSELQSAPPVPATVDWQQALDSVATDVMEQAKQDAARSARVDKPRTSASFEPLYERPHDFEWISQHSHLVINAQGVPEWVLIQHCAVVIALEDPDCTVEHIERHGVLYEYVQQQHDARLGY